MKLKLIALFSLSLVLLACKSAPPEESKTKITNSKVSESKTQPDNSSESSETEPAAVTTTETDSTDVSASEETPKEEQKKSKRKFKEKTPEEMEAAQEEARLYQLEQAKDVEVVANPEDVADNTPNESGYYGFGRSDKYDKGKKDQQE